MVNKKSEIYDVLLVGGGISGSFIAEKLAAQNLKILLLEAGQSFSADTYPVHEARSSSKLYWGGGIEFNKTADIALLRPKVVGGGSVINGALVDRFDDIALDDWRTQTGVSFFNSSEMTPWYEKAESMFNIEYIPPHARNTNAEIFAEGMKAKGLEITSLRRAQKNCEYEKGNDCVECLSGCRIGSKQMMSVSTLQRALDNGLEMISEFEVETIKIEKDLVKVFGLYKKKEFLTFYAKKLVLSSGAIGNTKILLKSGYKKKLNALGEHFYTHPQYMNLAVFDKKIDGHKKALQSYKTSDPKFRQWGFKLENVFAPPAALSMLFPGFGIDHMAKMKKLNYMACIEVAIRDTNPGRITLDKKGNIEIDKTLNEEDKNRRKNGVALINEIFGKCGAKEIIEGKLPVGLHLMGGCSIGVNSNDSVVNPDFNLHEFNNVFVADSSIFPRAPGINPSLTVMALSVKASDSILRSF